MRLYYRQVTEISYPSQIRRFNRLSGEMEEILTRQKPSDSLRDNGWWVRPIFTPLKAAEKLQVEETGFDITPSLV